MQSVYKLATHERPYYWSCQPATQDGSYYGLIEFKNVYYYYLIKVLDLADTIFFILRKKTSQVSFLHVYHHVAVLFGSFITLNWFPGKLFVHSICYLFFLYFRSLFFEICKHFKNREAQKILLRNL